ncbi:FAD-binding oxidoreductase [Pikeienuella sp. HZG-20]|uniref:NAD(P)/FAD-dependent oxidoreductase n=1 Tax=Paludibacillus litoralis TaxID=3133267 RepID=UPI0030ECBA87
MSLNLLHANDAPGVDAPSWYAATAAARADHPPLKGRTKADICVVGGGYTGLSAALHLAERGFDVVLLDAHRVGWGASGRNGGQVGSGQRLGQRDLEALLGRAHADQLWALAEEAKALVKALIRRHAIACSLRPGLIHAAHRARLAPALRRESAHLAARYGHQTEYLDRDALHALVGSPAYHAGLIDPGAAHLHPLNYALGLARAAAAAGVRIHENSEAVSIEDQTRPLVRTADGVVEADQAILACNGYLGGLAPDIAARVMPINNFIIATEPLTPERARSLIANDMAVADTKFVVNYYRLSPDRRLLFGGGESYGYRFPSDIKAFVRTRMLKIYPQLRDARIDFGWGGTLAITRNRMPHLARSGAAILSASGYSGHGVAMATLAGALAAEAAAGQAERFDIFASVPSPRFPGGGRLRWPLLALAMLWYRLRDRL